MRLLILIWPKVLPKDSEMTDNMKSDCSEWRSCIPDDICNLQQSHTNESLQPATVSSHSAIQCAQLITRKSSNHSCKHCKWLYFPCRKSQKSCVLVRKAEETTTSMKKKSPRLECRWMLVANNFSAWGYLMLLDARHIAPRSRYFYTWSAVTILSADSWVHLYCSEQTSSDLALRGSSGATEDRRKHQQLLEKIFCAVAFWMLKSPLLIS